MNIYRQPVLRILEENIPLEADQIDQLLSVPSDSSKGNFTLPCFILAKSLKKSPKIIAEGLAENIPTGDLISKVEPINGYLNFFLTPSKVISDVLSEIELKKSDYGKLPSNGKNAVIDYSSPNIGKQLAFHHLRSTMIGNALYNTYKAAGWTTTGINHLGDWGTQFGKLIVVFRKRHPNYTQDDLSALTLANLNEMYVDFGKLNSESPDLDLDGQARAAFSAMEKGDQETLALWQAFKDITLKELGTLYELMGVRFDSYVGEAFFNGKLDAVVDLLNEKELLVTSQERDVVLLDENDWPPCLIKKSDGSSLYATRDLAAALYRQEEYKFDRCLYVVDNGQSLHFKQVFKVLELCDKSWAPNLEHIPFGLILQWNEAEQKWSKGSSKSGNTNTLREVFEAAQVKILEFINEKNPELADKEDVAMQIGIGALVFNDLKNKRLMDVKFDWKKALSFEGDTGPYVQNAHVRLCSIMRKANYKVASSELEWNAHSDKYSYNLILLIAQLSSKIDQVTRTNEPYILTQFSLQIAEAAHKFIHHNRVIGGEHEKERLFLVQCTQQVLENTLKLIGVNPLRFM